MRIRRVFAGTIAVLALGTVLSTPALAGPGLPPIGDKCAMQAFLGVQNVRACEDETS